MIEYETCVEYNGESASAMQNAKNIFATHGFELEQGGETELVVTGPGMRSTKQNTIFGLTRGRFQFNDSTIEFKGELGGVEFMRKFLYFFPPALGGGLCIFFALSGHFANQNSAAIFTPLLCIAPWIFLSPIMAKSIKKKTERAIDTILHNMSRT